MRTSITHADNFGLVGTAKKLLTTTALTAAGLLAFAGSASADPVAPDATPQNPTVVGGSVDYTWSPGRMDAQQHTVRSVTNWGSFNIGRDAAVEIHQGGRNWLSVNRVTGNHGDPTQILGQLKANGQVMVLDRDGVFFGQDARIDVGGIVASTGDISDDLAMNGDMGAMIDALKDSAGPGSVINQGTMTIAEAGIAAFVAPYVANSGIIQAKLGTVELHAVDTATVDLYGDGLVELAVDEKVLAENTGVINAEGGTVIMTADTAKEVVDNVINMEGVINVSSVEVKGGKIILGGGANGVVSVTGDMNASGTDGGEVDVRGKNILATGDIKADGEKGGKVVLWGNNATYFSGLISAQGENGFVETSGGKLGVHGTVLLSQGGEWLLDPTRINIVAAGGGCCDVDGNPIDISGGGTFSWDDTADNSNFTVLNTSIEAALNAGNNITLQTHDNGPAQDGDILVNATITKTSGLDAALRLEAHDDIEVNQAISSTFGALNVELIAGYDESGALGAPDNQPAVNSDGVNDVFINANITTNGGHLLATADHDISTAGGTAISTSGGDVTFEAISTTGESNILIDGTITTDGGNVNMTAGDDIRVRNVVNTGGSWSITGRDSGDVSLIALGNKAGDLADVEISGLGQVITSDNGAFVSFDGDVFIQAQEVKIAALGGGQRIDAAGGFGTDGIVTITRSTEGEIGLGAGAAPADAGHMEITQVELAEIDAYQLVLGNPSEADNLTTAINVSGADSTTATIQNAVILNALHQGTGLVTGIDDNNVNFSGFNTFNALIAKANDDITFDGTVATVVSVLGGDAEFEGDSNDGGVGDFIMGLSSELQTNGGNVIVSALNFLMEGLTVIDTDGGDVTVTTSNDLNPADGLVNISGVINASNGGNILFNNAGVFTSVANSLKTNDGGTIELNQWEGGSIQNAVDAIDNTGDGQNTINVGAGTYSESVIVDHANLALLGANTGIAGYGVRGAESIVTGNSPAFTVNSDNVTIDGFLMDGPTLTYGVLLNDVKGTEITNNVIKRSSVAGVGGSVDNNVPNGTLLVAGNLIDDSNTGNGINIVGDPTFSNLIAGVTIDILNNEIGTDSTYDGDTTHDGVGGKGIVFANNVTDASVINVSGNDVYSTGNAVEFSGTVNGSTVNIFSNNDGFNALAGNGIVFLGNVVNASVQITSNIINSLLNGIQFNSGVANSYVRLNTNTIDAEDDGIQFNGNLTGETFVLADYNQIDSGDGASFDGEAVDFGGSIGGNSVVIVQANTLASTGPNNAVEFSTINTTGLVALDTNTITSAQGGVQFGGTITNSEVVVAGGSITAGTDGVQFTSKIDGSRVQIDGVTIDANGGDGIVFEGAVDPTTVNIGQLIGFSAPVDPTANPGIIWTVNPNTNGNSITGSQNGISFEQGVTDNSTVNIVNNDLIEGEGLHGINFGGAVNGNATVNITDNHDIQSLDNGINFADIVNNALVNITGNNDGITSGDHGIYFGGALGGGAVVNIHDNIITANTDAGVIGSGIFFNGGITNATVNIGDGNGASNPSNFIVVQDGGVSDILDGIHFAGTVGTGAQIVIDGNRIGYAGTPGNHASAVEDNVAGDGIEFASVTGDADIDITDNHISAGLNGLRFGTVDGTANVLIGGYDSGLADYGTNYIDAGANGVAFLSTVSGQALVEISWNEIEGNLDGILFQGQTSNAALPAGISQQEIFIDSNTITGGNNGIRFAQNVSTDLHDIRITNNTIDGQSQHGINFAGSIGSESQIWILNNVSITGDDDGIHFNGTVSGDSLIEIIDNAWIEGEDDDAIDFVGNISGNAVVRINSNDDIRADDNADNGIEFAGVSGNAVIEILENNHGIHADGHGIYFGGTVTGNADIDIHDNIINADDNDNGNGDGIHFASGVNGDATVNIGDGDGATFGTNPSNIISGENGIYFGGQVDGNAAVVIDGNRLGFYGTTLAGPYSNDRLGGSGVYFADNVDDDASVVITDNHIRADEDGVHFDGEIFDDATVLIGGAGDGNTINANDDGVQFADDISDRSVIEISYNTIDVDSDGVVFNGNTSNALPPAGTSEEEILIASNSIEAGDNGIRFDGRASGELHDIMIRDNTQIHGNGGHGIVHTGGIDDAELRILNNDDIFGETDGIHLEGFFFNDALILVDGNTNISADNGDGIEVTDTGLTDGSDVDITNNSIDGVGDNGIEVSNVDGVFIGSNDITDAGNDGINVDNSDDANIVANLIFGGNAGFLSIGDNGAGRDGIHVEDSDDVSIRFNDITGGNGGFLAIGGAGAGRDGIYIENSDDAEIRGNDITGGNFGVLAIGGNGAGRDGIHVEDSENVDIRFNDILGGTGFALGIGGMGAGRDGIYVDNSDFGDIRWNDVSQTGDDGIDVRNSFRIDIVGNDTEETGGDGIQVRNSNRADVLWNEVRDAGDDGIDVENSAFADINNNHVHGVDNNGIEVSNSFDADINDNNIHYVGGDGIFAFNVFGADIRGNDIHDTGDDGIDVRFSDFVDIVDNVIDDTDGDAIQVRWSDFADIITNTITNSGDDGIDLENSFGSNILTNNVNTVDGNGIEVEDSDTILIDDNVVQFADGAGIFVDPSTNITVSNNLVSGNNIGIWFQDVTNSTISNNVVDSNLTVGIQVEDSDQIHILSNDIFGNPIGLYAIGGGNGEIIISDNTFMDNTIHGKFESGLINLTGPGNTFLFGNVGLYFSPYLGDHTLLSLVDNDAPGSTPFGSQFPPTNFAGTIGAQTFRGQSQYFVQLDNNAFNGPVWLNGMNSRYYVPGTGYVRPADLPNGGAMSQAIYAFLEGKFQHYPDDPNVGVFFFGYVPGLSQEDLFELFGSFNPDTSGLNVTVLGLPGIPGGPNSLSSITPFAGEEGEEGTQVVDVEALNAIETAAGESDPASCWGDAIGAAGGGQVVNYSFGTGFDEMLNDASSCSSAF